MSKVRRSKLIKVIFSFNKNLKAPRAVLTLTYYLRKIIKKKHKELTITKKLTYLREKVVVYINYLTISN